MAARTDTTSRARTPLSRERVLNAALALADSTGIDKLSMRRLGMELGVEAMSLYNHVANKDDLVDGILDLVAAEIELPLDGPEWRVAIRTSAISAHAVLLRHPWACNLAVARPRVSPAKLRLTNATVRTLRSAGFSLQLAHNALHAIDGHIYGFTLQELSMQADLDELGPEVSAMLRDRGSDDYPHIAEMFFGSDHDDQVEFELVLDLILDGLERMRDRGIAPTTRG